MTWRRSYDAPALVLPKDHTTAETIRERETYRLLHIGTKVMHDCNLLKKHGVERNGENHFMRNKLLAERVPANIMEAIKKGEIGK